MLNRQWLAVHGVGQQDTGDQLCSSCDVSGATAIVTVQYGVENINRPPTLISTGSMVSAHSPQETSPSYFLLASQAAVDPIHNGSPTSGSVSAVFTRAKFLDIDAVDWRLDNPLIDTSRTVPQPHGPSVEFVLNFRGWQAGVIMPHGFGTTPLPPYEPNSLQISPIPYPTATAAPAAQQVVVVPAGQATPAPAQTVPTGAPMVATAPAGTAPVNPSAPYSRQGGPGEARRFPPTVSLSAFGDDEPQVSRVVTSSRCPGETAGASTPSS